MAKYQVILRIDGTYLGDVRSLAQNLSWTKCRTFVGVDSISFNLNDELFNLWCQARNTSIDQVLKPMALECRIVRDGVELLGGYLATMPSYQPNQVSANLSMQFDGWFNYLGGVYMPPVGTQSGRMGALVQKWITYADDKAKTAGKAFNFVVGDIQTLANVEHAFDNYKLIKDAITDRCDNTTGAGKFEVVWHADRTYDVVADADFGEVISDYIVYYPTRLNGVSATSISAPEASGFYSHVIGIGAGEISSNADENTAITYAEGDNDFVKEYGYAEELIQNSEISVLNTLKRNVQSELARVTDLRWSPEITLIGKQVAPVPSGSGRIWIGDTITIVNNLDRTGMTNGAFRVKQLDVSVSATDSETITPTLERVV